MTAEHPQYVHLENSHYTCIIIGVRSNVRHEITVYGLAGLKS